jgi:hypothetical protein
MTQAELFEFVESKCQLAFDTAETMKLLQLNQPMYWSWGVEKKMNYANKALMLCVNGNHLKGWVIITLGYDDTYSVYYTQKRRLSNEGEQHNVYFDMLADVIDDKIERIADYKF